MVRGLVEHEDVPFAHEQPRQIDAAPLTAVQKAALARELREELDVAAEVGRVADAVYYRYPDRDVLVLFYMCRLGGEPRRVDCNDIRWVAFEELAGYDFAGADEAFVKRLF